VTSPHVTYALSLHDALPIYRRSFGSLNFYFDWNGFRFVFWNNNLLEFHKQGIDWQWLEDTVQEAQTLSLNAIVIHHVDHANKQRSEEHTSELQSRENLVCRL